MANPDSSGLRFGYLSCHFAHGAAERTWQAPSSNYITVSDFGDNKKIGN